MPGRIRSFPMTMLVVLALVAGGVALSGCAKSAVPDVAGRPQAEAAQLLADAGFRVGRVTTSVSRDLPDGNVISQRPAAGTQARAGKRVDLVIAAGKPTITVPDVRNRSQTDAAKALQDAGLTITVTSAPSATVPNGLIAEQTPPGGQAVPAGTTVAIVVSTGAQAQNVSVPGVVGMPQADANNTLAAGGLQVAVAHQSSSSVPAQTVLAQTPAGGSAVPPGTTVAIVISTGPAAAGAIAVPSVAGLTLEQARKALQSAGLQPVPVAATGTSGPADQVATQTPEAGAKVASGSSVVLFYTGGQ